MMIDIYFYLSLDDIKMQRLFLTNEKYIKSIGKIKSSIYLSYDVILMN